MLNADDLTLHVTGSNGKFPGPLVVVGEVLWDVFPDSVSLGGAPLNFAVHSRRLGHRPILISGLGPDDLGQKAAAEIAALGLDVSMLRWSSKWPTGTAAVVVDAKGQPSFRIARPAAYDDILVTPDDLRTLATVKPSSIYYGTLFPSTREGRATLELLLDAMPRATRFYDVNLRPGFDCMDVVADLLAQAQIVKLNESEAQKISRHFGLPSDAEPFCRSACARFGWLAVCVTLGERGCAMFDGREFVRADGERVQVADTVGAGDAFAAVFLHGLSQGWPLAQIARFANRIGALVASRAGAIPDWSLLEAVTHD